MSGITNQAINKKIRFKKVKDITPLELIRQVVDNISTQILSIDLELLNASQGDSSSVSAPLIHSILGWRFDYIFFV